jgi:hypothetical protein
MALPEKWCEWLSMIREPEEYLVVPYVEPKLGASEDLNEDAVLACVTDHIRGHAPADVVAISRGIDVGDNEIHWVIRAVTADNDSYLVDHGCEKTQLGEQLETRNAKHETRESTLVVGMSFA